MPLNFAAHFCQGTWASTVGDIGFVSLHKYWSVSDICCVLTAGSTTLQCPCAVRKWLRSHCRAVELRVVVMMFVMLSLLCDLSAADSVSSSTDSGKNEAQTKSFYGTSTPQPTRPPVNNVRVYNGGAPVGFVDTPSNIHPIASLTPYQNRWNRRLLMLLSSVCCAASSQQPQTFSS